MHTRIIRVYSVILLVMLLFQVNYAGQKLRYRFEPGKTYKYSTIIDSKISGQMGGQEFTMSSGAYINYSIVSTSSAEKTFTLTATFDKFDIKINMPMMGFKDSTITMNEYIGKRMKVVVTNQGKNISVDPIDTIPPSRLQMMANINPSDMFKQLLLEFPEKELNVNDSWKKDVPDTTTRNGIKMKMKHNIDFKVAGLEKKNDFDCWKIAINGTSAIEGSGSQRGTDVTVDGTVKINGQAYFAPKEGLIILSEQPSETDLTTTATGQQTGASTMSINTTVKTELIK